MSEESNDKEQQKKSEEQKRLEKEKRQREIEEILSEANAKTGEQLVLDELGGLKSQNELKEFALGHIPDDPEQKYDVYYKGVEKLLKKFLPEGDISNFIIPILSVIYLKSSGKRRKSS